MAKSSVEKLKDALYSRAGGPEVNPAARTPLSENPPETPHSWDDIRVVSKNGVEEKRLSPEERAAIETMPEFARPKKRKPLALYFLWGSLCFFLVALALAAYAIFGGVNTISSQNIDLQIVSPPLSDSGKPATVEFIIDNRNQTTLKTADLIVDYPDGTRDAQNPAQSLSHVRNSLGDIEPGQQIKQSTTALFYGPEGSQKNIHATLEYQITGSNAIFTKEATVVFSIGSAPVSLSISSPEEAISGQTFSMDVIIKSNANSPLDNVAVQAQYPFGFSLNGSNPSADVGNTLWRLGTLSPGESHTIHLTGTLTGEDNDERVFHFLVGSENDLTESSLQVPLLSAPQTVTIHKPFVSGSIAINGKTGSTVPAPLGQSLQGRIQWKNNSSYTVTNLSFVLSFSGGSLDPSSVRSSDGFYDSTKNQIIWTSPQNSSLQTVAPGASGEFDFNFASLPPSGGLTNPKLTLNLTVHGSRTDTSSGPQDISSAASTNVQFASSVALMAQALHFTGPIANTGPMPPTVGAPTTYTVLWTVKNSSNTIAGSQVQATLPPYVTYVGPDPQSSENISYNATGRTVTWSLGDVKAGAGYSSASRQVAFEISITPSLSQLGQAPLLTSDASFTGQDRFAQATVQAVAGAVDTRLIGDSGFSQNMSLVTK